MEWSNALSSMRNCVMHDGAFDRGDLDVQREIVAMLNHLHDLVLRLALRLLRYSSLYNSPVIGQRDLVPVDWVTTATTPADLGYR